MATWSAALAAHLVPARVLEQRALAREWEGAGKGQTRGKLATGVPVLDGVTAGGWPRGALSEVSGPRSSGRTTLLYLSLGQALAAGEAAALVDVGGGLDPRWAQSLGVPLQRLLWVRCGAEQALAAADMVVGAGGFAVVALDFGDQPVKAPTAAWQRLKRAAGQQRTAVVLSAPYRPQGALGKVSFRLDPGRPVFHGGPVAPLLLHLKTQAHLDRGAWDQETPANTVGTLQFMWTRLPAPADAPCASARETAA